MDNLHLQTNFTESLELEENLLNFLQYLMLLNILR